MYIAAAILLSIIFFFLSGLHIYWGLGGKWGLDAAVPHKANGTKRINPSTFDCIAVAFLLLAAGFFVLVRGYLLSIGLPPWLLHTGSWVLLVIFTVRAIGEFRYVGFFKKVKSSRFARLDTKYYSPLCVLIAALLYFLEFLY
jgi:hypothetical protein